MRLTGNSGFAQLGESLFSDPPEQSNQKRGGPAELKAPRSGVIYRVGLIRHPCLKHPLLENPVLATRKITHATRHTPLGSSEGGAGATTEQRYGIDQVTLGEISILLVLMLLMSFCSSSSLVITRLLFVSSSLSILGLAIDGNCHISFISLGIILISGQLGGNSGLVEKRYRNVLSAHRVKQV